MTDGIIMALISGGVTLLVCMINNRVQHDKTIAVIDTKLTNLTKQVEKHNTVIERTYQLENRADLQDEKMKVANHRIEDLESRG